MARNHPDALPAGYRLEEYEVVRVLGSGGFGITYLARDSQLHQQVALKEYFPHGHASRRSGARVAANAGTRDVFDWGFRRFVDEARALHRFRHPNVVGSRRYFRANGTAYIVLEYVQGQSLAAILDSRGRLSLTEWRPWLDRLLDGLEHVHAQNYLHRDITPRNILIRAADSQPVLIDFGAARIAAGERTRTVVLTEAYAPIEQHSPRAEQGPFTDIYSVAAVSYRALTGRAPPSAPDRAMEDRIVPLAQRETDAPEWMDRLDRALALAPKDRPQAVSAWRRELNIGAAMTWTSAAVSRLLLSNQRLPALHRAAAAEPIPEVVALVLSDGDIHAVTRSGRTPLHSAARGNSNPAVLALLLDRGADIQHRTRKGGTPLHFAAWGNPNPAVVALLLDRGADIDARSEDGTTALHAAAWKNQNPAVVALLLDRGADIHARTEDGATPLHAAAEGNGNPAVATLLLDRGANVHAETATGRTPVHSAARGNRDPAVLALLLDRGADIHRRTHKGGTPLHSAVFNENPEVVALLLARGADVNARERTLGGTPLHWAVEGHPEVADLLHAHGGDWSIRNYSGTTPLELRADRMLNDSQDSVSEIDESADEDYYRFEFGTNEAEEQMAEGYAAGDDEDDEYAAY